MQGVVKTFLPEKQYGFIKGDDGKDYFFHTKSFKDLEEVKNICEESRVEFDQTATPKGYQAKKCKLLNPEEVNTYVVPEDFITSRSGKVKGWEILEESEWFVHGCSRDSPDAAKRTMISRGEQVGSNTLLFVDYYKETGEEAGTGSGTHLYTIHCFRGRLANIAKRNVLGSFHDDDLLGIHDEVKSLQQGYLKEYEKKQRRRKMKLGLIFVTAIAVAIVLSESYQSNANIFTSLILFMLFIPYALKKPKLGGEWLQKNRP